MQLEERLSGKERELEEREKRVQETEERMMLYYVVVQKIEENVVMVGPVVKLNVGTEFVSSHFQISYLSVLFSLSCPFLSFSPLPIPLITISKLAQVVRSFIYQKLPFSRARDLILMH
jgi:hypothetical protein